MKRYVFLKAGREKSVLNRHPWLYSGAIKGIKGDPSDGEIVSVFSTDGAFLAWGYLNRRSQIAVRLVSWSETERIDSNFWRSTLKRAIAARSQLAASAYTTAYRLVNAESDGLPGLVVDRYGEWVVLQFLTLGMELRRKELVDLLAEELPDVLGFYERSDASVRSKEGLLPRVGPLIGDSPPAEIVILENGLQFGVDLCSGHKTGFYLDQRENRERIENFAAGAEMANFFSYTGAFSVYAARGGVRQVTNVDTSSVALELARRNMAFNGFEGINAEYLPVDVFDQLRRYRDAGRKFDLIVLDPPKFAHSQSGVRQATRAYKDINWLGMRLLRPGGTLFTFSCSGAIGAELFQKVLFGAALDAGRDVQVIGSLSQSGDHPILLSFPQSAYLKGMICRVW